jgi:hypothetical protein
MKTFYLMIKTLLLLKYNVKEGQELIENSLVTRVALIRPTMTRPTLN